MAQWLAVRRVRVIDPNTYTATDMATGQPYFCGCYIMNGPEMIEHIEIMKRGYNSDTDTQEIRTIIKHT